jgi:hypothetical protein
MLKTNYQVENAAIQRIQRRKEEVLKEKEAKKQKELAKREKLRSICRRNYEKYKAEREKLDEANKDEMSLDVAVVPEVTQDSDSSLSIPMHKSSQK